MQQNATDLQNLKKDLQNYLIDAKDEILDVFSKKINNQTDRQLIQKKIEDELAELFLLRKIGEGSNVQVVLDNKGEITII